jgi:uncharacterized protein (DUF2252 family)
MATASDLSNFGAFASPERRLLFDLNDFDETLPGPFEYDVKRMAASFTVVSRNNGFSSADTRDVTMASVTAYREATLRDDQRHLLERFQIVDMARKVVGVGSVGTLAFIVLLQGRDAHDPLFLQIKEATALGP